MTIHIARLGAGGVGLAAFLAWQALLPARLLTARTQEAGPVESGVVYHSVGPVLRPLEKVLHTTGGVFTRSARIKGGHSSVRITAGQPDSFRVCGVDPTRYKLYAFQSTRNSRTLKIASINSWTGAGTAVISRSEIPLLVSIADSRCFEITPKEALDGGEYGFNMIESFDLFMFGVDGGRHVNSQSAPAQTSTPAQAREVSPREVGVVYYADGSEFRPLVKETAASGGRPNYIGRVKGAHSPIRLSDGQPHTFRVCDVDPTRYKMYTLESTKKERTIVLAKIGLWGAVHDVLPESEIPVAIQAAENNCYTISPKAPLKAGEYGFSPVGTEDVFMFGVGDIKPVR